MKKLPLLAGITLLASCTTFVPKPTQIPSYTIEFSGARNDLNPAFSGIPALVGTSDGQPGAITYSNIFPLADAVECDAERTVCKHAIISTQLNYGIREVGTAVEFSGYLNSTMGRKVTQRIEISGSVYTQTNSIPDGIPVIGSQTINTPFSFIYIPGKRVVIDGLQGVRVVITFAPLQATGA